MSALAYSFAIIYLLNKMFPKSEFNYSCLNLGLVYFIFYYYIIYLFFFFFFTKFGLSYLFFYLRTYSKYILLCLQWMTCIMLRGRAIIVANFFCALMSSFAGFFQVNSLHTFKARVDLARCHPFILKFFDCILIFDSQDCLITFY